jgi:hypothetical protein
MNLMVDGMNETGGAVLFLCQFPIASLNRRRFAAQHHPGVVGDPVASLE